MVYFGQYPRQQPRQPEAKPPVVHTDQSENYDDSMTTALITAAVQDNQQEKEPTMSKKNLPLGRQGGDVVQAIITNCTIGTKFTAELVWSALGAQKREQWINAYGGRDKAYRKVASALNNINASGRIGIERVDGTTDTFRYTSQKPVAPSTAYQRSIDKHADVEAKADNVPEPAPPETKSRRSSVESWYNDLTLIGFSLTGDPIVKRGDGTVGRLDFRAL